VAWAENEEAVQALAACAADERFGQRVRPRGVDGCLDDPDPLGCEDGVEGRHELRVAIVDQELGGGYPVREVPADVSGRLGHPRAGWVGGDAGEATRGVSTAMKNST